MITQPMCMSLQRISQKNTPTHHRQEGGKKKETERRWRREQHPAPHPVSFHRQHLLKQEASTATATATATAQLRLSEANKSRRLVVEASISKFKYLTEQVSGPFMSAQKYFFFFFLAAGRQPTSETPTFFFEAWLSDLCRWRTLTSLQMQRQQTN